MNIMKLASEQSDRKLALLALAATKKAPESICPPDENLAAFIEGQLKRNEHKAMLTHLSQCNECYYHWQDAFAFAGEFEANVETNDSKVRSSKNRWQGFKSLLPNWNIAVPAIAAAALSLLVVIMLPESSALNRQMDNAYISLAANSTVDLEKELSTLPLPWETGAFGFDSHNDSPSATAFGTGLVDGKSELSGEERTLPIRLKSDRDVDWADSKWSDYYNLGRWTLLSWSLSKSDKATANDWVEIQKISEQLLQQFNQRPADEQHAQLAAAALKRIDPILSSLQQQPSESNSVAIGRRLEITMQQFFVN